MSKANQILKIAARIIRHSFTGSGLTSRAYQDKLREELLNREIFGSLSEAQVILESWRFEYVQVDQLRPHTHHDEARSGDRA